MQRAGQYLLYIEFYCYSNMYILILVVYDVNHDWHLAIVHTMKSPLVWLLAKVVKNP